MRLAVQAAWTATLRGTAWWPSACTPALSITACLRSAPALMTSLSLLLREVADDLGRRNGIFRDAIDQRTGQSAQPTERTACRQQRDAPTCSSEHADTRLLLAQLLRSTVQIANRDAHGTQREQSTEPSRLAPRLPRLPPAYSSFSHG